MRPIAFRSSHVRYAKSTITTLTMRNALTIEMSQGSCCVIALSSPAEPKALERRGRSGPRRALRLRQRRRGDVRRSAFVAAERSTLADFSEREAVVAARRDFCEDRRCVG